MDLGNGTNRIYNILSLVFAIATLLTCLITTMIFFTGGGDDAVIKEDLPELLLLPTDTPTTIPSATLTPLPATFTLTFTPTTTATKTLTATATTTVTQTIAASATITSTTLPSTTPTPTQSATPTLPPIGTLPPTPSPYLFAPQQDLTFIANANTSCAWQGIAGQVLDVNGNAYPTPLQIRVTGAGLQNSLNAMSGSNTIYGPGGYEVQVANGINTSTYFVELYTNSNTKVSETIAVAFSGACEGNLAQLTFQQTRPN